ncbi:MULTISPECIES: GTP 3',8-cyclase MoaA [Actinomycetes]|uniref:GTP 3',8-cyclase n=1 Tax=Glutamicibacter arilaitensis (strain DSM 16368 / CIP 108037 / IAM 15318 / JCM 13566 / NCIMB 14258 / Re117) TaxID=861360 RepID=A0ABP1U012_GLUAR|nr:MULTISPECIES: GTP 3',8-cyclase MoaA [Glutamicibacter]CBT74697.1 molybdenum cofactor biosynthesis protein A [Glutamicibacter arilaitensis Re117]HCH48454.1 GTP 3',8-cyclase MoaA [Glutamicibacter sp.]HCJ54605.1 GTP 3',8-cyclase MoaA [Glutamicibacter sp.]HCM94224.1 GTP 3',8-cyclase MoaA [Glutamicibacter sp.]
MKAPLAGEILDARSRPLHDLRISVTDRCNFRCVYCMPKEIFGRDFQFRERSELLSFEEIERLARISVSLGVTKLRLTGGEPLLRRGIVDLVAMLSNLRTPEGKRIDLAMTTNGSALPVLAPALKEAGLNRVTISLDSLDDEKFKAINDVNFPVSKVLEAIQVAREVGLGPVKINTVIKRGVNDSEILSLAEHFRGTGNILRFIEFMDVGTTNGWKLDEVLPSAEVVSMINERWALEPVTKTEPGETANRWRYKDGAGEIGVISSVTNAFCGNCSRARVSAEGQLYTCLFAGSGYDLRQLMRDGISDEDLAKALTGHWRKRDDNYSELRAALTPGNRKRIEMSYIGG